MGHDGLVMTPPMAPPRPRAQSDVTPTAGHICDDVNGLVKISFASILFFIEQSMCVIYLSGKEGSLK